jgi:hypothetical protein
LQFTAKIANLDARARAGRGQLTILVSAPVLSCRIRVHQWSSAANIRFAKANSLAGASMKDNVLAIASAIVGGAIGVVAFWWLLSQGLYGLVLPGGLLGIGAGLGKNRSIFVPIVCGVAALVLGFAAEWYFHPFIADDSFSFFVSHLFDLLPATFLMIALGTWIGFWVPYRRPERKPKQEPSP